MNVMTKSILLFSMCAGLALPALGQNDGQELKRKVDAVIAETYKEAIAKFPCRLRTTGKAKMGNWKDVENCVNPAHDLVNWEDHAAALKKIREEERVTSENMAAVVESALTERMISYDRVFLVKEKDEMEALLPLSNSLLKFLPENSLASLPVFARNGELLGTFLGVYSYERSGGLEILSGYRMTYFQYTDLKGNTQTPTDTFLIDSFGVPWRDARFQQGFRLPSNKLLNLR